MAPIIDESLNTPLQSYIVLPFKDTYKDPFVYCYGDHSPIIVTKMDADVVQGISPASSLILGLQGPGLEPSTYYENSLFGQRCGISFYDNDDGFQYACSISTLELLCLYGVITQHGEINPSLLFTLDSTLDFLLPHRLTYEFRRTIMHKSTSCSNIRYAFISSCN